MRFSIVKSVFALFLVGGVVGCDGSGLAGEPAAQDSENAEFEASIEGALRSLPAAKVTSSVLGVPRFVEGNLGHVTKGDAETLKVELNKLAPVFGVEATNLALHRVDDDALGSSHARYRQTKNGLRVVRGDLVVHYDQNGVVYAANGSARDKDAPSPTPQISAPVAAALALESRAVSGATPSSPSLVYIIGSDDQVMRLAYEVEVSGEEGGAPVRDLIYVDAKESRVLERHPQVHSARQRRIYVGSLSGTLKRSEGAPPTGDALVDKNYDAVGKAYDYYRNVLGRDSFNGAGFELRSAVRTGRYDNAYWNGSGMTYGDGASSASIGWGSALDVVGHELTHGVTQYESGLIYWRQSGGINESMSDIFGESVEAWVHGNGNDNFVDAQTFQVAEEVWTPGVADALRYMDDPAKDGVSIDDFARYSDSLDVHYSSGLPNLAWSLLVKGGKHPRGKYPTVVVPALGKTKATKIFYRANIYYLFPGSTFRDLRNAAMSAANDLYGSSASQAVALAFAAVGVAPSTAPTQNVCPGTSCVGLRTTEAPQSSCFTERRVIATAQVKDTAGRVAGKVDLDASSVCAPYLRGMLSSSIATNGLVRGFVWIEREGLGEDTVSRQTGAVGYYPYDKTWHYLRSKMVLGANGRIRACAAHIALGAVGWSTGCTPWVDRGI